MEKWKSSVEMSERQWGLYSHINKCRKINRKSRDSFWQPFVFTLYCTGLKSFIYPFLLPFLSRLPRRQGSVLYCTTGIILQWLRSDPWVPTTPSPHPCFLPAFLLLCFSSLSLCLSVSAVLPPLSYSLSVTLFYPHWFMVDSTVCGRSISMGPHSHRQRNEDTHTHTASVDSSRRAHPCILSVFSKTTETKWRCQLFLLSCFMLFQTLARL